VRRAAAGGAHVGYKHAKYVNASRRWTASPIARGKAALEDRGYSGMRAVRLPAGVSGPLFLVRGAKSWRFLDRSPDGGSVSGSAYPDYAALHPGYKVAAIVKLPILAGRYQMCPIVIGAPVRARSTRSARTLRHVGNVANEPPMHRIELPAASRGGFRSALMEPMKWGVRICRWCSLERRRCRRKPVQSCKQVGS